MLQSCIQYLEKLGLEISCKISNIKNEYFFIILGLFSIFPLLILSFFNNPGSDDFDLSYESQVESFWSLQIRRYFDWSGRYFSNGLISFLDPLIYGNYFWFKIIPILLMVLFFFSIVYFISSFQLATSRLNKFAYAGAVLFLYIYQMPNVSDGFYWIPGSFTNQLPQVIVLLFFSMLFKYIQTGKTLFVVLASFFLFAAIGCNEITVVSLLFILFLLFFYNYLVLRKFSRTLFLMMTIAIIFGCVEVLAPGNIARAESMANKHQLILSVLKSFQVSLSLMMKWMPMITICCFFFFKSITQIIDENISKKYIIHPFFSICLVFLIVYIGVFPCFWSTGSEPPVRTANTIYFFFIIAYINFIFSAIYYFIIQKKKDFSYSYNTKICIAIIIIVSSLSNNNITVAYHDLLTGKAYKYNNEMVARIELINNCHEQECVLPQLLNMPKTICNKEVMALTNDKNNWKNLEIARYFRKKSIIVKPVDSLLTE
jgi:Family of unknown function (DUF6056)